MLEQDTICALSTAPGVGAIAVVRLSGPDALAIARRCSDLTRNIVARTACFCRLRDAEGGIDEGLVTWFPDQKLAIDMDQIPALAEDRERLWSQIGTAGFLSDAEKRALLGLAPANEGNKA